MRLLIFILAGAALTAQVIPKPIPEPKSIPEPKVVTNQVRYDVTARVKMMDDEVWEAAFAGPRRDLTLYSVQICNKGFDPVNVQAGLALNQTKGGLSPVDDPALALIAAASARKHSRLYALVTVARYLAMIGTFLATSQVVEAGQFAVVFPLLEAGSRELAKEFKGRGLPPVLLETFLMKPEKRFDLAPGGCETKFVMGSHEPDFIGFEVPVM
jgi:hypothetical protein